MIIIFVEELHIPLKIVLCYHEANLYIIILGHCNLTPKSQSYDEQIQYLV